MKKYILHIEQGTGKVYFPFCSRPLKDDSLGLVKNFNIQGIKTGLNEIHVTFYQHGYPIWEGKASKIPRYIYINSILAVDINIGKNVTYEDENIRLEWEECEGLHSQLCKLISDGNSFILGEEHIELLKSFSMLRLELQ